MLGRALLEDRPDGVYAYISLNNSERSQHARSMVEHGDIKALSIFASSLKEQAKTVLHGLIKEVSLVISGANKGATIDFISFAHADGVDVESDEDAIITTPGEIIHMATKPTTTPDVNEDMTVGEVFDTLSDLQKNVVYALIGQAVEDATGEKIKDIEQSDLYHEGDDMKHNIFTGDNNNATHTTLSHADFAAIVTDAKRVGSLKQAFIQHGITDIDYLFPDAKTLNNRPELLNADTSWVPFVFGDARKVPFSRVKSVVADLTADEARAKGYTKGNLKVDEVIALLKRTTNATTIYKKQKIDRDDMVDITDLDVVGWLKWEMRFKLDEELAQAALIGDGRLISSDDKIDETCIRPIYTDSALYAVKVEVAEAATTATQIEEIIRSRKDYKGSGNPVFFCSPDTAATMLLLKDTTGRRLYRNIDELATELRVSKVVEVPVFDSVVRDIDASQEAHLLGIIVNMQDYTFGADKGGEVNLFDDFDIDYNQYKYLIETRVSGALTKPHSAIVVEQLVALP